MGCGELLSCAKMNPTEKPQNYWVNTSSNDIIRHFIERAEASTKDEIELLVNGGCIKKKIRQDLDSRIDNLWSILFTTGYLTQDEKEIGELTK